MANFKHTKAELKALRAKQYAVREASTNYENPFQVLTFAQWCRLGNFSGSTGKRILASEDGPRALQLSARRKGVRLSDHQKWVERLAKKAG